MCEQASGYSLGLNTSFMLSRTWHLSELLFFLFCKMRIIFAIFKIIYLLIFGCPVAVSGSCALAVSRGLSSCSVPSLEYRLSSWDLQV